MGAQSVNHERSLAASHCSMPNTSAVKTRMPRQLQSTAPCHPPGPLPPPEGHPPQHQDGLVTPPLNGQLQRRGRGAQGAYVGVQALLQQPPNHKVLPVDGSLMEQRTPANKSNVNVCVGGGKGVQACPWERHAGFAAAATIPPARSGPLMAASCNSVLQQLQSGGN